jgi:glycosyltransferase involved in cell wall biosynthesis
MSSGPIASFSARPLRVAIVALYPAPGAKAPGGVRTVVQGIVRGLQTYDDLQIHVIHCHADIATSADVTAGRTQIHYIAMPKRRLVPNTLASIPRVERLLRQVQPDVVNTHAAHYTVAALRSGFPTVFTIHGVMHREAEVYTSTLFDRARLLLERWLDGYAVRHVRDIVAISPYVLDEYRGRSNARFHRIDNPLAPEFFAVPNLEKATECRLLYAGTIDERKNVLDLLRALAIVRQQIPSVRLRVAGRTTSPSYEQKVRRFVAEAGLVSNVEFLGLLDKEQMLQEYARCLMVVLASRQETMPMAVTEAMAAGKPVVATRVGGVPELVKDGDSGYTVSLGDVEGLAQRILELLNSVALRTRLGQRARQLAGRFQLETVAAEYRQLYYQVAGRALPAYSANPANPAHNAGRSTGSAGRLAFAQHLRRERRTAAGRAQRPERGCSSGNTERSTIL